MTRLRPVPSAASSVAGHGSLLAASQYAAAAVGMLTSLVLARWLGPTGYGVVGLAIAYPTLVRLLAAVKSAQVITGELAGARAAGRAAVLGPITAFGFALDLGSATLAAVVVAVSAPWVAPYLGRLPAVAWWMTAYAVALVPAAVGGTAQAVLASWGRFGTLAALQVLEPAIGLAGVLVAFAVGWGPAGAIGGLAAGQAATGVLMAWLATGLLHADGVRPWQRSAWRHLGATLATRRGAVGWSYVITTMGALVMQAPIIVLGRVRGPEEAGYYRLGGSLMTVGTLLEISLNQVAYPVLAERASTGMSGTEALLRRWTLWPGLPVAGTALAAAAVLPWIVPAVLGPGFEPLIPGARLMLVGVAAGGAVFWRNAYCFALGRFDLVGWASVLFAVVVAVPAWTVAARWGFVGLAVLATAGKLASVAWLVGRLYSGRPHSRRVPEPA